ncbi:hypothetical protein [Enterococcus sp. RIT-PI-f]|uniref:hypothetical protein n=1 Tax=Enterococcus sp. RIT-PI-f TaxID=1690244 RepID=UPI00356A64C3
MDSRDWIKRFLKYCDQNKINPWEFDFKQSYMTEPIKDSIYQNHFQLELAYKNYKLEQTNPLFNTTGYKGKEGDCDKEPFPIYNFLGWQKETTDQLRGDAMNSYDSTFNRLITIGRNKELAPYSGKNCLFLETTPLFPKGKETELASLRTTLITNSDILKNFPFALENKERQNNKETEVNLLEQIEIFAKLTHSIGNFTILLSWMNTGRGSGFSSVKDYFDLTLKDIHDSYLGVDDEFGKIFWREFVKKYYLQPFVTKNYIVSELWKGHFNTRTYPQKIEDFEQFYHNVNLLIEERGKWITKQLCNKLDLKNLSFYSKLEDKEQIKFFDEIIK